MQYQILFVSDLLKDINYCHTLVEGIGEVKEKKY